jgi:hypothetical protein
MITPPSEAILTQNLASLYHLELPFLGLTCTSGLCQSPGVDLSKTTQYYNMGSFSIDQPRKLSRIPDVQVNSAQSLIRLGFFATAHKIEGASVAAFAAQYFG